jgi:penicillin-binding protein 1B
MPLVTAARFLDHGQAPYFLQLAEEELRQRVPPESLESNAYQLYTSLDLRLQEAAEASVRWGMDRLDGMVKGRKTEQKPQIALVALDPHTGEVRAVVGGRSFSESQLNRAVAKRQPGSSFKPFVYAAALNAPKTRLGRITLSTVLKDEPMTFQFGDEQYQPSNFGDQFYGEVTVRQAITRSLNIPAVQLARAAGLRNVVELARAAGLNHQIRATPSIALGAYEVTPLELAGGYTIFANEGTYMQPTFINSLRVAGGGAIIEGSPATRQVLDKRIAWLTLSLLQGVVNEGTGGPVRMRGLWVHAAGKTGSSHDGWFAGFTSDLLCVVWVGYDDNADLDLEGSKSAAPIWGDFMKRALDLGYQGKAFPNPPPGLASALICTQSGLLAGDRCERTRTEFYLWGTQPGEVCVTDHVLEAEEKEREKNEKKERKKRQ